jgi:hypothetical protein
MRITKITNNIVRVHYQEQEALTRAFCRIQESYESPNPEFKERPFTLGEYRVWYTQETGAWTYYTDWNGFNVPSDALQPFIAGLFDPLTVEEKELVDALRYREGFYYVIGTHEDDDALPHELCHALYTLNEEYQEEMTEAVDSLTNTENMEEKLMGMGYSEDSLVDEMQAYLACDSKHIKDKFNVVLPDGYENIIEIRRKYFKELGIGE